MGKRTYESDIVAMALFYRKEYASTDMLSYDKILNFDKVINNNLDEMEATCGIGIRCENTSNLYFVITGEDGQSCAVINPNVELKMAWKYHVGCLPIDVLIASQMDNALKEIGLISVNDKIMDRNTYYSELSRKYNLLYEFTRPKFNVFRDWESVPEDGFVEKFCISDAEQSILKELREIKKINDQNAVRQINVLKKSRRK